MWIGTMNVGAATVKAARVQVASGTATVRDRSVRDVGPGEKPGTVVREAALEAGIRPGEVAAVGHRVVHGGSRFHEPVPLDPDVVEAVERLIPLAPLHNAAGLQGIRAVGEAFPDLPMVAVFDTGFHAGRSRVSTRYALPRELTESDDLYRYGFHGIAHASLVEALAREEERPPEAVTAVTLQLGGGCSACAVREGRSEETSMGFTPLEGLVMATRSGDLDPGLVLYLLRHGRSVDEVEELITRRSGLRGMAGTSDMREVLRGAREGDEDAELAVELFVHRLVQTVGAYLTLLEGRGAVVFGGGIGTHAPEIRARVADGLSAWDVELDDERNASAETGRISADGRRPVYALETNEEALIARETAGVLAGAA